MANMNEKTKIFFRLRLWWRRPLKCILGFHKDDWNEWSYPKCAGIVFFHCANCQKVIKKIPVDDLPPEKCKHILIIVKDVLAAVKNIQTPDFTNNFE